MALAGRHRLVERVVAGDVAEQLAIAAAEARDAVRASAAPRSPAAARPRRASPVERWLIGSNERIASSTSPNRSSRNGSVVPGGKRSTRPPRTANSPGSITVSDAAVAVLAQELGQPGDIDRLALAQHHRRLGVEAARRHLLQGRAHRGQDDARRRAGLLGLRRAAPASPAARRRCRDAATAGRRAGSPRPGRPAPRARARRSAGRPAGAPAAGRRAPRAGCPARRWCARARPAPARRRPRAGRRWSSGRPCDAMAARVSESDATRTSRGTP